MNLKKTYNILLFILLLLLYPSISWAYLDPGTGTFIIQLEVATFIWSLVYIKLFESKITDYFTGKKEEIENTDDKPIQETESTENK